MTTATTEHSGAITFKGAPLTLVGDEVSVGQTAPDFKVVANDLSDVTLSQYRGKVVILSSIPSLDTPVCDIQTRRFNQEIGQFGDRAVVLTLSLDLPFAQKRWCGAADATNVVTLSDYKYRQFGPAYGLLIKELGLLARAVLVVDAQGVIRHKDVVGEMTQEPDYEAALNAVRSLG